jgi:hypothetical protein
MRAAIPLVLWPSFLASSGGDGLRMAEPYAVVLVLLGLAVVWIVSAAHSHFRHHDR